MPKLKARTSEQRIWLQKRNKFVTGFCNDIGKPSQCEGTHPKSHGTALPTCPFWQECPCECHWNLDEMFSSVGKERVLVPNQDYDPPLPDFIMPYVPMTPHDEAAVSGDGVNGSRGTEHPVGAPRMPAAAPLASRRTDTGRAARGGLEAQVWEALTTADLDEPVTPKDVGAWLAEKYKIPTPSSGAINAVWDRWVKLGYAEQAKKPNRFVKFTGTGSWEELQRLKSQTRTAKKSAESAARRGFR